MQCNDWWNWVPCCAFFFWRVRTVFVWHCQASHIRLAWGVMLGFYRQRVNHPSGRVSRYFASQRQCISVQDQNLPLPQRVPTLRPYLYLPNASDLTESQVPVTQAPQNPLHTSTATLVQRWVLFTPSAWGARSQEER